MEKGVVRYLPFEDILRLRAALRNPRDRLIIDVLYQTGCTVKELVKIAVKDLQPATESSSCAVNFPSANRGRTRQSAISKELCRQLTDFVQGKSPETPVFSSRQSEGLTTKRVRQIVQASTKRILGEALNPHILRYTHIAHALLKQMPLPAIQRQVGLDSLRMSQLCTALMKKENYEYQGFFE